MEEQPKSRRVFNSTNVALLPPQDRYKGEWPKKPKFWQIYGTVAARYHWQLLGGFGVGMTLLGLIIYKVQPKISFGIFDRYIMPNMFYNKEEREDFWKNAFFDHKRCKMREMEALRESDLHIPTREIRDQLASPGHAWSQEKHDFTKVHYK